MGYIGCRGYSGVQYGTEGTVRYSRVQKICYNRLYEETAGTD